MSEVRRLYKAREGLAIDGVCSGIAEYVRLSATAVRIMFVILAFAGFWGVALYILGMVLIPRRPAADVASEQHLEQDLEPDLEPPPGRGWASTVGYAVMIIGGVLLLQQIGLLQWRFWRSWQTGFDAAWPLSILLAGWVIVARYQVLPPLHGPEKHDPGPLVRTREERMIAGVCGGVGRRLGLDVSLVRVLWAFLTLLSWGVGAVAYAMSVVLVPEETPQSDAEGGASAPAIPEKVDPAHDREDNATNDPSS